MAFSTSTFTTGTTVTAGGLLTAHADMEEYLNTGIVAGDFESSEWVRTSHIYKPDFRIGAAPRVEKISGDHHFRKRVHDIGARSMFHEDTGSAVFRAIPGLGVTFHVPNQATTYADLLVSLYVFEIGGGENLNLDIERDPCAHVALFFDDTELVGTRRRVFASTVANYAAGRKQISMVRHITSPIDEGWHSVSVRLQVLPTQDGNDNYNDTSTAVDFSDAGAADPNLRPWRHIIVEGGNLSLDLQVK